MVELSGRAPAKINLVLEVLGRRDDGYHEIDTVLQTVSLADRVTISTGGEPSVRVTGPYAAVTPTDSTNSAWRAAAALAKRLAEDASQLAITIEKNVPAAGGLGGGSSDAATTLRLLQKLWPRATGEDLAAAAAEVGSDDIFFLTGSTARAQGRGERVTPLAPLPPHGVVLFIPPDTLERKTARLFAALAGHPFDDGSRTAAFLAAHPRQLCPDDLFNAFERVAFSEFPSLGDLRDAIEARIGASVRLSGAGPSMFWIGPPEQAAAIAARAEGLSCDVIATATAQGGP